MEWGRHRRLKGRIARARGDLLSSRSHLERSAATLDVSGPRIEMGRVLCESALLSIDLGQVDRARRELIEAQRVLQPLGPSAELHRVEQVLAGLASS